jgi:mRNA-degrading endonuclease RelE of RelBE toxin-antitoxin system
MGTRKKRGYEIRYTTGAAEDLAELRAYIRGPILDAIDEQLTFEPEVRTRNKQPLVDLVPPWEFVPPLRELRVGSYRVFYDVDEAEPIVVVRAIREKPPEKRTEDIL